jgi:predicted cupin superfamily sugar epimerase
MSADDPRVRELVTKLELAAHPEGGFFREIFRSPHTVTPDDGRPRRSALTVIHFLLPTGAHSRWHEVRSDEQWTFLEGAPLELLVLEQGATTVQRIRLGPLSVGATPTAIVPAGAWQATRAGETHGLVTCTVGPGFDFVDFRLLAGDSKAQERIAVVAPELVELL